MSIFTNPASSSVEQAREYTAAVLDLVGGRDPLAILEGTPHALRQALAALPPEQMKRPEAPGKWAPNQVLQHLADSELVWGYRLRMVLAEERPSLTGYDQDVWAARLHYAEAEAASALEEFSGLRKANLRLLGRMSQESQRVGVHSERGEESVEHMIRLYAGHDLLHLQQLDRIRRTFLAEAR